jgi:hypothetical protein
MPASDLHASASVNTRTRWRDNVESKDTLLVRGSAARKCSGYRQIERGPRNSEFQPQESAGVTAGHRAADYCGLIRSEYRCDPASVPVYRIVGAIEGSRGGLIVAPRAVMSACGLRWSQWVCRHEWLHHRTACSWRLACARCGAMTPGFDLPARRGNGRDPGGRHTRRGTSYLRAMVAKMAGVQLAVGDGLR